MGSNDLHDLGHCGTSHTCKVRYIYDMYMKQLQPRFTVYNGFGETACFYSCFTFSKPNRMSESSTVAALMLISSIMAQGQVKVCQTFYLFITSGGSRGGEGNVRPL